MRHPKRYGILIDTFFNPDRAPKAAVENIRPRKNTGFHAGGGPVAYIGNTGDHEMSAAEIAGLSRTEMIRQARALGIRPRWSEQMVEKELA